MPKYYLTWLSLDTIGLGQLGRLIYSIHCIKEATPTNNNRYMQLLKINITINESRLIPIPVNH